MKGTIYKLTKLNKAVDFLDSKRIPVKSSDRKAGPYPYYGANGQQGTIDGFIFDEPLILLAEDGGHFFERNRGIAYKISGKTWVNNHAHVLRPKPNADIDYLCLVLKHLDVSEHLTGTTRAKLTKAGACRIEIPLPPIDEQKRIAGILDTADALRAKRRESLAQLDTLLQSTFFDMFGDPVTNPKGWEIEVFDKWLSNIDSGWSPKCLDRQAKEDEWGVLKLSAVTWCEFNENEQKALPAELKPRKEIEVQPGDLLFTRKNTYELVAAVAYVRHTRPKLMLSDLIFRLRLKPEVKVDLLFLWYLLKQPHQRQKIQELAGGAAGSMPNISKTKLKTINLIKPPLSHQHRFATIVESIEKQKTRLRAHLAELDTLFASLQSRAFNGEL